MAKVVGCDPPLNPFVRLEQPLELIQRKPVGHPGDVVADHSFPADGLHPLHVFPREEGRVLHVRVEELAKTALRLDAHPLHLEVVVQVVHQEKLQLPVFSGQFGTEADHLPVDPPQVIQGDNSRTA